MRFARPRPSASGTPLAPLLDVVLLLLIFFVVTSSFSTPTLELALPPAASGGPARPNALVVAIDEAGAMTVDGRAEDLDSLVERLEEAKQAARTIELRADRATDHEHVVAVLDRAQSVGVEDLSIAVGAAEAGEAGGAVDEGSPGDGGAGEAGGGSVAPAGASQP